MPRLHTPQERKDALRAVLSGAPFTGLRGRTLPPQETLLGFLKGLTDDEEIAEFGRIFKNSKTGRFSGAHMFPASVATLDDDKPYTQEDLIRDAEEFGEELAALPQNRLVDVSNLENLDDIDSPEHVEAMLEAGGGVTVLGSPNPVPQSSTLHYNIKLSHFECIKESGEVGKDEIYWALAVGADEGAQTKRTTNTHAVKTGWRKDFSFLDRSFFSGQVQNYIIAHIECWEADHSNSAWYDKMLETMAAVGMACVKYAAMSASTGWGPAVLAVAGFAAQAIAVFLDIFRNKDDLVFKREFHLDRSALDKMRSTGFDFNGGRGGHQRLWLKKVWR
ncbi:hypothetical protein BJY04DRAFT_213965 [Aspergillus karnatakaensis]|uniref:uncharacterized protein n=1 Tax=Aspergillus karnatakaensis TaxID=1810916 RepID=UPI003CCD1E6A